MNNTERDEPVVTRKQLNLLLTLLTIFSIIASAIIAASITQFKVDLQGESIKKLEDDNKAITLKINEHETYIQVLNSKLDGISSDVKEIKQDVKVINRGELN
jgi:outer membrane murein-binding lipoprotein Lpp